MAKPSPKSFQIVRKKLIPLETLMHFVIYFFGGNDPSLVYTISTVGIYKITISPDKGTDYILLIHMFLFLTYIKL